ncbi:phage portal protein, partial [Mesorhizobium sp. M2D.F.Ca.ET.153.01.1.1]|uniref:anti-CBASS protein Acb1 family protein n=1 Tax=Mesorhizobium sp. M2D.F.Ca.ET.153.01.1.1 TaxID=2500520 RepID=UPI001094119A
FEAKVDVIKIPNFMSNLADQEYEQKVLQRLTLAAMAKGVNGALLLDAEEEYEQKQAQFGGLVDLPMGIMQLVSGASDIPMTRLLGQSQDRPHP